MASKQKFKILIADDDEGALEALGDLLTYEGYLIVRARNGLEAFQLLRNGGAQPDLIILDLLMPVMDGWEFRTRQKQDPKLKDVPVIVVTAIGATAGIDAARVLHKPVDVDALLRAIEACG